MSKNQEKISKRLSGLYNSISMEVGSSTMDDINDIVKLR